MSDADDLHTFLATANQPTAKAGDAADIHAFLNSSNPQYSAPAQPKDASIGRMIAPAVYQQHDNDSGQSIPQKVLGYTGAAINDLASFPYRIGSAADKIEDDNGQITPETKQASEEALLKTGGSSFKEKMLRTVPLSFLGGPEVAGGKGILNAASQMLPASAAEAASSESQNPNGPSLSGMLGKTAAGVALGAVTQALGEGASALGTKIVQSSIKPSQKLLNAKGSQFDVENLLGPDAKPLPIDGAPSTLVSKKGKSATLDNLTTYNEALDNQRDKIISSSPAQIDATQAVNQAALNLKTALTSGKYRDMKPQIEAAIQYWGEDAKDLAKTSGGPLQGEAITNYRQGLGNAARFNASNKDATPGGALVAGEIYSLLNDEISKQIPELRPIDAEFSKIIPLQNAIATSIGREGNAYPIGLREAMVLSATYGLNPASLIPALGKAALIRGTSTMGAGVAARQAGDAIQSLNPQQAMIPAVSGVLGNNQ